MDPDGRKTVLKTIRLSHAEEEILRREAKAKGVTFNALVSTLITRFIEWDRFADKYGFIALPRQSFRYLTSLLHEEQLEKFGRETGLRNASAIAHFWFKRLGVETFLNFLSVSAKYCGIWHYEIDRQGPNFVLTVHSDIDPAYAVVHRHYFDQAIRGIVGTVPKVEQKGDAVVFTFAAPTSY
jgi:hypothetical protein